MLYLVPTELGKKITTPYLYCVATHERQNTNDVHFFWPNRPPSTFARLDWSPAAEKGKIDPSHSY